MTTKKILDNEPIPGGNPDRPTKQGVTRTCSMTKCSGKEFREGLCSSCWDDFQAGDGKMSVDEQNEAWDRARNS
jgi:hypothetical protein